MNEKILFSERLREARLKADISQAELSRKTGIASATLSSYEKGKMPPIDKAIILADALGVSLDWLAGRSQKDDDILTTESVLQAIITLSKLRDCEIKTYSDSCGNDFVSVCMEGTFLCNFAEEYTKIIYFMKNPDYPEYLKTGLKNALLKKFVDMYSVIDGDFCVNIDDLL